MNRYFVARLLPLVFLLSPVVPLPAQTVEAPLEFAAPSTNRGPAKPLSPGLDAGRIAFVTGGLLEQLHYSQQMFDDTISSKFLDQYLKMLDPQRVHFLQSDIAEFDQFRDALDNLTITRRGVANTGPAYDIFNRFRERLEQRVAYVDELLKKEPFRFDTNERITLNRRELPYPKNLDEAKALWRQRVRYEYLMEKLAREEGVKTNSLAVQPIKNNTNAPGTNLTSQAAKTGAAGADKAEKPKTMHEEIVETIGKLYHRNLNFFRDWDSNEVLSTYLNALAHTYDPHSDYQAPPDAEDFAMHMNLSLFGIGASLQLKDGYCEIRELLNGPALKSKKIKVGDRIVAVAQGDQPPVNIIEMPLTKAVRLIRGPKGTEVRLTIIPAGAPNPSTREVVTLIRDEIKLDTGEAKGRIIELPQGNETVRIGVIDLPSFYATIDSRGNPTPKSTSVDVQRLLQKFTAEKVAGVILDLRRNGGGSLEEAVRVTGLFIKRGPVVQIRDYTGRVIVEEDTDPKVVYDGPLIVLTSRVSASASEIVAGALQDYGRALIVGDVSTFGKGTAQRLFHLQAVPMLQTMTNDPGTLKITNSKFYRASGASTELKGVNPDIVLPSIWNHSMEIGENRLDNHLPWDEIESAEFPKMDRVQPYLAELTQKSAARTTTHQDFLYLREDIEQFKKSQADKTVSLNEKEQLREWREAEARKKEREKERLARKEAAGKSYQITLKNVDQPGLPAPIKIVKVAATEKVEPQVTLAAKTETNPVEDTEEAEEPTENLAELDEDGWRRKAALEETQRILLDYISLLPREDSPILLAK